MQNGSAFWRVALYADKYEAAIISRIDETRGRRIKERFGQWWRIQVCYYLVTGAWPSVPQLTEAGMKSISVFRGKMTEIVSQLSPHEFMQLTAVLLLELEQSGNTSLSQWRNVYKKHNQNSQIAVL